MDSIFFNGLQIFENRYLPQRPINGMEKQPWWLTDDEYRKHQDWCGDFFGWTQDIFIMPGGNAFASPEHIAMLRNVLSEPPK